MLASRRMPRVAVHSVLQCMSASCNPTSLAHALRWQPGTLPGSGRTSSIPIHPNSLQVRGYHRHGGSQSNESRRKDPSWQAKTKAAVKVTAGAGVALITASVGLGSLIIGSAGYGVYSLYRIISSRPAPGANPSTVLRALQRDYISLLRRSETAVPGDDRSSRNPLDQTPRSKELKELIDESPGFARTLLVMAVLFADGLERVAGLRRLTREHALTDPRVTMRLGNELDVALPEPLNEYEVGGIRHLQGVFLVVGEKAVRAQITTTASIGEAGDLSLIALKYVNLATDEAIDLMGDNRGENEEDVAN